MRVTRHLPGPVTAVDLVDAADNARLDELYRPGRPEWLSINLVASIDGAARGGDGTSGTLTRGADRKILGAIRRNSSVVLVGATTVRTEGHLFPRSTSLAVATLSGDLTGHSFSPDLEPGRLVVICPEDAAETVRRTLGPVPATVIPVPAPTVSPQQLIDALRARGYATIVCEGGPLLASELIDAGLVDELCLTTSPVIAGSPAHGLQALTVHDRHELELAQLLTDSSGSVYARWRFKPASH